ARFGFAWTPYAAGRPVIHGAVGIFYGSVGGNLFTYSSNGEPFSGRPSFSNVIHVSHGPEALLQRRCGVHSGRRGPFALSVHLQPQESSVCCQAGGPDPAGPELPLAGGLPDQLRGAAAIDQQPRAYRELCSFTFAQTSHP